MPKGYKFYTASKTGNSQALYSESFFGRFIDGLRFQFHYWLADDLSSVITDAIAYFSTIRPLRKLSGKPPVQFRIEQAV